ncbi:MAG: M14 family zinc carboxypeptidase, partial [Acidobacteriota bacterium]
EFLSPLVDHLAVAPGVPSPKDVLGYHIGAPKKLTYYADILNYYRTLASRSPRVRVVTIGKTDEGRELAVVFIAAEETIRNLELYRDYLGRLADPRGLSEAEARDLIPRAKPIYHLIGGLHSPETGPPEMLMELAYRLAVDDSALIGQIRDKIIVSITPVAEPDGRDRYVDWYYRHLVDIDDERARIGGPPYWGKYVYHDNNRDIHYSQVSTRALLKWYLEWHPPIMHDIHESVPYLYTFSGQAPQNPTLDPILYGELPWFANFEMAQMTKYGMPGVWTHAFVDMWSPGYMGFMSSNHNGLLRMYEVFGNGGATTMKRKLETSSGSPSPQTEREWYRPSPPYKEVEWSIRNNINYGQTGVLSALQLASAFPEVILDNFYRKSRNSIESGRKDPPHGYVIPAGQRDMTRVELLAGLLRTQGIEVSRAVGEIKVKEGTFPSGSLVVKRDQPYGRLAKIFLEKQEFPDPNLRTYDDTGWTLGLATQTEVREISDKSILDLPVETVTELKLPGKLAGAPSGPTYAVAHFGSNRMITLRYRLKGAVVRAAEKPFQAGDVEFPAGSFLISAGTPGSAVAGEVRTAVESLGLTGSAAAPPSVPLHEVDLPRLAVYSTWGSTQEVGWVRHALDQFEVTYDLVFKERVRQGNLRAAYDVVLIPNQGGSAKRIVYDVEGRDKPLAYTRTEQFRYLGAYGESEDIRGGMGLEGLLELQKFVQDGGVIITLGTASFLPADFGLTRSVNAARPSSQFYAPGPIVEAEILQPDHPIFYGYAGKTVPVRYANGPLLDLPEEEKARRMLMKFSGGDKAVLSGLMKNPGEIKDRPAIIEVPVGKGRVIMYATNPCYRWQTHGEFNMLFNAILHFNDMGAPAGR